jgi:starch synthase
VLGKCPFEDLPELLRKCDVLVFPSYCEGFALVLLEALASGMPIITTDATAGPDLIDQGSEGFLIPSGNLEALRESMKYFVDHPEKLHEMSIAARRRAEDFSWDSYGDRWQQILKASA